MQYIIIGSGIAGATAAETIKKEQPDAQVLIITNEVDLVYNKVVLPNYLKGRTERERLFVKKREEIEDKGIKVLSGLNVIHIDTQIQSVTLENGDNHSYDKLLIATGGRPKELSIAGGDLPHVFKFHTLVQTEALIAQAQKSSVVAVTGGGFISLELVDALHHRGIETHLFLRKKGYWSDTMDPEQSERITQHLQAQGIHIHTEEPIQEITENSVIANNKTYDVDFVAYGIGLDFNIDFILNTGIQKQLGIVVNEYLQTSDSNIYAAGDVAEYYHPQLGRHVMTANWNHALLQGKVAALNMVGQQTVFDDITYYTMNVRGLFVATLGETDPQYADAIVVRKDAERYVKILVHESNIIGASFVGGIQDLMPIRKMIEEKVVVDAGVKDRLANSAIAL